MMIFKKLFSVIICVILSTSFLLYPVNAIEGEQEIVDPYKLYTYDQMLTDIAKLEARFPALISSSSIGKSVDDRDIPVFTLGTGKREILVCASMHAREYVSTNFVMYMTEQYCKSYENDEVYAGLSYRQILDTVRFVIVPMLNPDGVIIAQNGLEGATNPEKLQQMQITDAHSSGFYGWKANANGVDLNRNWPYNWAEDKKVKAPASANYNGTGPCTEPEVIAMKNLIDSSPYYMLCSLHTSGKVIYWIDTSNDYEYYKEYRPIIKKIGDWIGYSLVGHEDVSRFGGFMVNYARGVHGKPAFTVELCPFYSMYPYSDYSGFATTVNSVLPIGLLMAEAVMNMEKCEDAIDVTIENKLVVFSDIRPVISNDRTLVPLRAACEAMGLNVGWNSATSQITVTNGIKTVGLTIGSNIMTVNETEIVLDTAPCIINERTMMPIRAVVEAFGYQVGWDGNTRTVIISATPELPLPDEPEPEEPDVELPEDSEESENEDVIEFPENDMNDSCEDSTQSDVPENSGNAQENTVEQEGEKSE